MEDQLSYMDWYVQFFMDKHDGKIHANQRLGQEFVVKYIEGSWPELFYADEDQAQELIVDYLVNLHYWPYMPTKIEGRD